MTYYFYDTNNHEVKSLNESWRDNILRLSKKVNEEWKHKIRKS